MFWGSIFENISKHIVGGHLLPIQICYVCMFIYLYSYVYICISILFCAFLLGSLFFSGLLCGSLFLIVCPS